MATLLCARVGERSAPRGVTQIAKDRLERRLHRASRFVTCNCSQGILLLRGRLATYYQKQLAQEAVKGLDGVLQVVNDIEVST